MPPPAEASALDPPPNSSDGSLVPPTDPFIGVASTDNPEQTAEAVDKIESTEEEDAANDLFSEGEDVLRSLLDGPPSRRLRRTSSPVDVSIAQKERGMARIIVLFRRVFPTNQVFADLRLNQIFADLMVVLH